jgi:hypothetical protein
MAFLTPLLRSPGDTKNDKERLAAKIASLSLELALQFGVHPGELSLLRPAVRDQVEIEAEATDCRGENLRQGDKVVVDLVVTPGVYRVVDGATKEKRRRIFIVPCEVLPVSNQPPAPVVTNTV